MIRKFFDVVQDELDRQEEAEITELKRRFRTATAARRLMAHEWAHESRVAQ